MPSLVPRPPEKAIVYLDRPQCLGFLPTLAFWNRRDVAKVTAPMLGTVGLLWMLLLVLFVNDWTPIWASGLLAGLGPYLFLGVLERIIRKRLRARVRLLPDGPEEKPHQLQQGSTSSDSSCSSSVGLESQGEGRG